MKTLIDPLINITKGVTPETALEVAHNTTAEPSLWIAWAGFLGIMFFITWMYKGNKGWGKFWQIFFITAFLSLLLIMFLANAPNFVQEVADIFSNLWK